MCHSMGARGLCSFFNHYPHPVTTLIHNVIFLNPECNLENFVASTYSIIKHQYGVVNISIYVDELDVAIYWAEKANKCEQLWRQYCYCSEGGHPPQTIASGNTSSNVGVSVAAATSTNFIAENELDPEADNNQFYSNMNRRQKSSQQRESYTEYITYAFIT